MWQICFYSIFGVFILFQVLVYHRRRQQNTSTFSKLFCKGTPVHKLRSDSSLAQYKLSFEPSTTSVRCVLLFVQQNSTNCTNSYNKKSRPRHEVMTHNLQRWLIAQMKAYTLQMKNFILIFGPEFLCRKVLKKVYVFA